jgi:predicted ribosome quality control (RQC) complex YloA/Tae2 family protein
VLVAPHASDVDDWRVLATWGKNARAVDGRDLRRGKPYVQPVELPAHAHDHTVTSSNRLAPLRVDPALSAVRASLKAEHKRLTRKESALLHDVDKHGDPDALVAQGEQLKGMMGRITRGMTSVQVVDDTGALVDVTLDPALDAKGNLHKLFARSKKARAARAHVAPRLDDVRERLAELAAVRARVLQAEPTPDDVLAAQEFLRAPQSGGSARRKAAKAGPRQPWRAFRVSHDVVVRVGRSARDNDALVREARGHDVWLHVRNTVGSHVIVPATTSEVHPDVLLDACQLAAHFSSARGEERVDVQHTRVKHLKKPGRGAPAGMFHVSNESVVHLRVDRERLAVLLAQEVAA